MKKSLKIIAGVALVAGLFLSGTAHAAKVQLPKETTLVLTKTSGGDPVEITTRFLDVIVEQTMPDVIVVPGADAGMRDAFIMKREELTAVLGDAAQDVIDAAKRQADAPDIQIGSRGDAVLAFQQALVDLNLLKGRMDGDFGAGTAKALKVFMTTYLPEAPEGGVATAFVQDLAIALANPPTEETALPILAFLPPTPESMFPEIVNRVSPTVDLSPYCSPDYSYTYDAFEQSGMLVLKQPLVYPIDTQPVIAQITYEIIFSVKIANSARFGVTASPQMTMTALGSRRPYVSAIMLKIGDMVFDITPETAESRIEGGKVTESLEIRPNSAALSALSQAQGECALRIEGKYQRYEIFLDEAASALLKRWAIDCENAHLGTQPAIAESGGVSLRE